MATADALLEGFRPGVMERLGPGPEPMLALALAELGYDAAEIDRLASAGAFGNPAPVAAVSP